MKLDNKVALITLRRSSPADRTGRTVRRRALLGWLSRCRVLLQSVFFHNNLGRTIFTDHATGPVMVRQDDFIAYMGQIS
jgi:hypothetical protein